MWSYVLKRIVLFVPSLFMITLTGFLIIESAPGDPVDRMLASANSSGEMMSSDQVGEQKRIWRQRLGLDRPVFYFSIASLSESDTLYRIATPELRQATERLDQLYGNPEAVSRYQQALNRFKTETNRLLADKEQNDRLSLPVANSLAFEITALQQSYDSTLIGYKLRQIEGCLHTLHFGTLSPSFLALQQRYRDMGLQRSTWKNYIPTLHWYGLRNRYHFWLFGDGQNSRGILHGDFGLSYATKENVMNIIREKAGWSLFFSIGSVLLAYLISLPLGAYAALYPASAFDRYSSLVLFALFSLPAFFMGVLLLLLFANPDVLHWFPASGVQPIDGYPAGAGFLEKFRLSWPHLVLPLICYTYSSLAFLSRLSKTAIAEQLMQDYIRTARAKGAGQHRVLWHHAFRNALLPLITVFSNVFPAILGGSVIIESIFSIPGMGNESVKAILSQDYPLIVGILTVSGVLTLCAYLLADLAYSWADPRIQL